MGYEHEMKQLWCENDMMIVKWIWVDNCDMCDEGLW